MLGMQAKKKKNFPATAEKSDNKKIENQIPESGSHVATVCEAIRKTL